MVDLSYFVDVLMGDPEKSDQRKSVIEKAASGRLKCFERCSISKRLAHVMIIIRIFFGILNFLNRGFCGKGFA